MAAVHLGLLSCAITFHLSHAIGQARHDTKPNCSHCVERHVPEITRAVQEKHWGSLTGLYPDMLFKANPKPKLKLEHYEHDPLKKVANPTAGQLYYWQPGDEDY